MIQLMYELETLSVEPLLGTSQPSPRSGLVFVPCAVCTAPVDLASIPELDQPQLCDRHAPGALVFDFT